MHDAVEVRASPIEGRGLVASALLSEGTVVAVLGGRLVSEVEFAGLLDRAVKDPGASFIDTITIYEDAHLVLPSGSLLHFGNHSCDPTLWHVDAYRIATRRVVAAGEELTIDYATNSGLADFRMECRCGSALCRGEITGEDWQRGDLQQRYRGHWVPALAARIQAS